jgi:hypothetical protein
MKYLSTNIFTNISGLPSCIAGVPPVEAALLLALGGPIGTSTSSSMIPVDELAPLFLVTACAIILPSKPLSMLNSCKFEQRFVTIAALPRNSSRFGCYERLEYKINIKIHRRPASKFQLPNKFGSSEETSNSTS